MYKYFIKYKNNVTILLLERGRLDMDRSNISDKDTKKTFFSELMGWIMALVFAVILALIIKTFIFNTTIVQGSSMYPTLEDGDKLISLKFTVLIDDPDRGDIVIFDSPLNPQDDYIKRVIAIEGDEVRIADGLVYVNGKKLDEYYIENGVQTQLDNSTDHWKIGKGMVFVLGDNRNFRASTDSRVFGEIPVDIVKGEAVFRYYPLNKIGVIH